MQTVEEIAAEIVAREGGMSMTPTTRAARLTTG